jgi:hypothetical protein
MKELKGNVYLVESENMIVHGIYEKGDKALLGEVVDLKITKGEALEILESESLIWDGYRVNFEVITKAKNPFDSEIKIKTIC